MSTYSDDLNRRQMLIKQVQKHPWIYQKNDSRHCDRLELNRTWLEIATIVGWDEEVCRSKWRNIRDGYRKFQRNCALRNNKNQHTKSNELHKNWDLSFLDDCPASFRTKADNNNGIGIEQPESNQSSDMAAEMGEDMEQAAEIQTENEELESEDPRMTKTRKNSKHPVAKKNQHNSNNNSNANKTRVLRSKTKTTSSLLSSASSPSQTTAKRLKSSTRDHHHHHHHQTSTSQNYHQSPPKNVISHIVSEKISSLLLPNQRRFDQIFKMVQDLKEQSESNSVLGTLSNMILQLPLDRRAMLYSKIFNLVAEDFKNYNLEKEVQQKELLERLENSGGGDSGDLGGDAARADMVLVAGDFHMNLNTEEVS